MKKVFKTAQVRDLLNQVNNEEITFSRLVEILNECANETYRDQYIDLEDGFFTGSLNVKRIKAYMDIAEHLNISQSDVRDIFSLGICFAVSNIKQQDK